MKKFKTIGMLLLFGIALSGVFLKTLIPKSGLRLVAILKIMKWEVIRR